MTLETDLEGHWKFDDGTANDNVGPNNGTLENTASVMLYKGRTALSLTGLNNDYVNLGSPAVLQISTNITISTWFKTHGGADKDIVSCSNDNGIIGYRLSTGLLDEGALSAVIGGSTGYHAVTSNGININDDGWHHCVITNDGSNLKLYLDGELNNSVSSTHTIEYINNLNFGRRPDSSGDHNHFSGLMDSVRIYSRALSDLDVGALYKEEVLLTDKIISKYDCVDLQDSHGGRDLSLNGQVALDSIDGRTVCDSGPWYYFGDPLYNPGYMTPSSSIPVSSKFTASLWFKEIREPEHGYAVKDLLSTDGSPGAYGALLQIGSFSTNNINGQSDHLNFIGARIDNDEASELGSDIDINYSLYNAASGWHQIVLTLDKPLGALQVWLDGAKHGSLIYGDFSSITEILHINGGAAGLGAFARYVDDIRFWSRSLYDEEIQSMWLEKPTITLSGDAVMQVDQGGSFAEPGYLALDASGEDITQDVGVSIIRNWPYTAYSEDLSGGSVGWSDNGVIQYSSVRDNGDVISSEYMHGRFAGSAVSKTINLGSSFVGEDIVINGRIFILDSWDTETMRVSVDGNTKIEFLARHSQSQIIQSISAGAEYIIDQYQISDTIDETSGTNLQNNWGSEGVVEFSIQATVLGALNGGTGYGDVDVELEGLINGGIGDESFGFVIDYIKKVQESVQSVDPNNVGNYNISYDVLDSMNIAATTVQRVVSVVDVTDPVITILGDSLVNLTEGDIYSDSGATIFDSADGNLGWASPSIAVASASIPALDSSLVAYYSCDSASERFSTYDGSFSGIGMGIHGADVPDVSITNNGKYGSALDLTAHDQVVFSVSNIGSVGADALTGSTGYTVAMWVYNFSGSSGSAMWASGYHSSTGLSFNHGMGNVTRVTFGPTHTNETFQFVKVDENGDEIPGVVSYGWHSENLILSESAQSYMGYSGWNHLAVSVSGDTARLYVNGVLRGRCSDSFFSSNNTYIDRFGTRVSGWFARQSLGEYIDDIAVWREALPASRILELASSHTASSVGYGALAGTYTITYSAQDYAGNTSSATRTVVVSPSSPSSYDWTGIVEVIVGLGSDGGSAILYLKNDGGNTALDLTKDTTRLDLFTAHDAVSTSIVGAPLGGCVANPGEMFVHTDSSKVYKIAVGPDATISSVTELAGDHDLSVVRHGDSELIMGYNNGKIKTIPDGGSIAVERLDLFAEYSTGVVAIDIAASDQGFIIISRNLDSTFNALYASDDWGTIKKGLGLNPGVDIAEVNYKLNQFSGVSTWYASDGVTVVATTDINNWIIY
jgi:hypothetical protein